MLTGNRPCHSRAAGCAVLLIASSGLLWAAGPSETPGPTVTLHGRAISLADGPAPSGGAPARREGPPVPGVKVTFSHHMPDQPAGAWTATTGPDGTFTVTVPEAASRWLSLAVEGPADGKLALCNLAGAPGPSLRQGPPGPTTLLFAPARSRLRGTVTGHPARQVAVVGPGGEPAPSGGAPARREGPPVAGATVTLSQMLEAARSGASKRTAVTDKQGRYEIAGLAAGRYAVSSVDPPPGSTLIRLYTWKPGGVRMVDLGEGAAGEEDFRLPLGARLVGRVLDETGKPVAGAAVTCGLDAATEEGPPHMYQMPGQCYSDETTTDAQGRYLLGGLTKETYRVSIQPPAGAEWAPASLRGVNAPESGDVQLQDATLYKGGKLLGLILGQDDKPVPAAEVSAAPASQRSQGRLRATTDAAGRFVLAGLPTDMYTVTVTPPAGTQHGNLPCWVPAWCEQAFDDVPVISGLAIEQRLKLPEGAIVAGAVTDPSDKPVAGAAVRISHGQARGLGAVTDVEGRFRIGGVAPAAETQHDNLPSRVPAGYRGQAAGITLSAAPPETLPALLGASVPLKGLAAGKVTEVNVRLAAGAAVTGRVTGPDGKPVPHCQVAAFQQLGRGGYSSSSMASAGPDGRYTLAHVPVGKWKVSVVPPAEGDLLPTASPEQALAAGQTATVDVVLKKGAAISGRVATARGQPVAGAAIRLEAGRSTDLPFLPGMDQSGRSAVTDSTGAFQIVGLPSGTFKVHATPFDPVLLVEPAEVKAGGAEASPVALVARATGSIRGSVCDAGGQPIGSELVSLRLEPPEAGAKEAAATAYPDAQGRFRLAHVLPGKYHLKVIPGKRGEQMGLAPTAPAEVVVSELKETQVDLKVESK